MLINVFTNRPPGDSFPALAAICNLADAKPDWKLTYTPRQKEWRDFFNRTCPKLTSQNAPHGTISTRIDLQPTIENTGKDLTTIYTEALARELGIDIPVIHKVPVINLPTFPNKISSSKPLACTISAGKIDLSTKHYVADGKRSPYIQEVIDRTPQFQWVQLGVGSNMDYLPNLKNVIDLRDKTNDPLELFNIVDQCELILTGVSLLAWVGATLAKRTLVVIGGREMGSESNTPLPKLPCMSFFGTSIACAGKNGCWKSRTVPIETGIDALDAMNTSLCLDPVECRGVITPNCMASITPDVIVNHIESRSDCTFALSVKPLHARHKLLITGGIGDAIALESHWDDSFRRRIEKFYYATRACKPIMEIFSVLFPKAKHEVLWDDWSNRFNFMTKEQLGRVLKNKPPDWEDIADWSIQKRFGNLPKFCGSKSVIQTLTLLKSNLPDTFIVIVPYSPNEPRPDRMMNEADWEAVHAYLDDWGAVGVILNIGSDDYTHPNIINLTGKTTILESIEILKRSQGYIGTDSVLSIIASQMFVNGIHVKSSGANMMKWKHVYYGGRPDQDFITRDLTHLKSDGSQIDTACHILKEEKS